MPCVIFKQKACHAFFPSMLEYVYVYRKVANYCLYNTKSFYEHKNVYKEIV
jgi:hypothetical protein